MTLTNGRRRASLVTAVCLFSLVVVGAGAVATGSTTTATNGQEEANISIQNLTAPSEVQLGTNYTVTAEIVNQGDQLDIQRVSYRIAGNVIEAQSVLIPADDTETVQFNVTAANTSGLPPGTYTHGVFAGDVQETANLTLTADAETPTPEEEETPTPEETPEVTPEETSEETPTTEETPTPEETPTTEETPTPEEETPTPEETETPDPSVANVAFEDQTSNGTAVTVESVTVPDGGFVVIHDESIIEGVVVDSMVGESDFLEAGTHQNVTVQLDESLNESQRLVAVVYRDENANQEYDFVTSNRRIDGPYTRPGSTEAVNEIARITVEGEEEE